jgi:hypothetical protein
MAKTKEGLQAGINRVNFAAFWSLAMGDKADQ